ncbi:hypothetical protein FHS61_001422 [Altererythrobacter atlanticus]|uniref:PilZ domain protein n=1 Tax=Croceibacterium atlanticum TaxID=1267766 RepID=A0A0F7KUS9_9SPHN|nr:PilZ domain-containing protein [Croceibacterium atlanticum]AKH44103.1 PilZ domain protein [Croceibacterium atlanticum]MBB5732413.1 hypothetical protein [Croceibacterium atlanticum]
MQSNGGASDAPVGNEGNRRDDERTRTIYRLVQILSGDDEGLARCRNISDGGAALHLTMPVQLNDHVCLNFSPSVSLEGQVVWVNGSDCGVKFLDKVDSSDLLRTTSAELRAEGARPPRLKADVPAWVYHEGRTCVTRTHDVSQRGVKLSHRGEFTPGLKVRVLLPGGGEKDGIVRWSQENIAGLQLLDPFSVEDLGSVRALSDGGDRKRAG